MFEWIAIFIVNAALDVVYAMYTLSVGGRKPLAAGLWAMGIIGLGAISIISYTHNPILVIPAAFGAFAGTYYTIKYERDK